MTTASLWLIEGVRQPGGSIGASHGSEFVPAQLVRGRQHVLFPQDTVPQISKYTQAVLMRQPRWRQEASCHAASIHSLVSASLSHCRNLDCAYLSMPGVLLGSNAVQAAAQEDEGDDGHGRSGTDSYHDDDDCGQPTAGRRHCC